MEKLQNSFYVVKPRFCFLTGSSPLSGLLAMSYLSSHLSISRFPFGNAKFELKTNAKFFSISRQPCAVIYMGRKSLWVNIYLLENE